MDLTQATIHSLAFSFVVLGLVLFLVEKVMK